MLCGILIGIIPKKGGRGGEARKEKENILGLLHLENIITSCYKIQYPLNHRKSKRVPEKHLLLLY